MSKLIRHTRTYTQYDSRPSDLLLGKSKASAIRMNTFADQTLYQSNQKAYNTAKNIPCQEPHIITINAVSTLRSCKTYKTEGD
jgi:hypothetical protein